MRAALEQALEHVQPPLHAIQYARMLPQVTTLVTVKCPGTAYALRRQSKGTCEAFAKANKKPCTFGYQVHHVVPLSLGGWIGLSNLAYVDPRLHAAIHVVIDGQIKGMKVGETREVGIPFIPHTRVWHLR